MKPDPYAKIIDIAPSNEQAIMTAAVREAVALVLSQDVIDIAIAMAIKEASLDKIPTKGTQLYDFIVGPLRNTIQTFAPMEESDLAITRLVAILASQLAKIDGASTEVSAIRRISKIVPPATKVKTATERNVVPFPEELPTRKRSMEDLVLNSAVRRTPLPPPPLPESYSLLLFTTDLDASFLFSVLLGSITRIETHSDIARFVEELESDQLIDTIVVVDFRESDQPETALACIAPSLPKSSPVFLWGADEIVMTQFSALTESRPDKWVTCSSAVELEDLVALIRCTV